MASKLPTKIQEYLAQAKADHKAMIARYEAAAQQFNFAYALKDAFDKSHPDLKFVVHQWLDWDKVKVTIRVKSFRDCLPVLALIERLADKGIPGYSFNDTRDYPEYNERMYVADKIVVEAQLVGEGKEDCKRVITGYTTPAPRPIYAFECGQAADQLPDHPTAESQLSGQEGAPNL